MLLTVATGVSVGVEQSRSSSHGDTTGVGSAFGANNNFNSICSIPHKRSKTQFPLSVVIAFQSLEKHHNRIYTKKYSFC